ncbi:prion-like-(Q/N-rich) domain-bearing protein 25 [Microplitis mediator]|uniref:prion-like-(Q/N-rich) domain-bearing protein 25 n=1 Tax=Microplitis mediator TaxID=375433 RepID=UPI0025540181|nr:prion-like-(Q/N-rich) domain-bearing protein 25 [Microplitis mediator]
MNLLAHTLGSHCEKDENCKQVRFARCSEEKVCKCASNTAAVNLAHCSPVIGGFCWTTDDCLTRDSICVHNKCQCKQLYIRESDNQCIPAHLNISCTDDMQCSSLFANSICSETKGCICDKNYFEKSGTECALSTNNSCSSDGSCELNNSVCINNICQCKPLFEFRYLICVPIYLNKHCINNSDCNHIQHAICSADEKCVCDENYIDINGKTCSPVLDGFCSEDTDCLAVNSICIKNECQCKPNFLRHSNKLCQLPQLGMSCKYDNDCEKILYSKCSENERCECMSTYVEYNTTACAPLLGRYCSDDGLCAPLNSICSDNICICDDGYIRNSIDKCIPHHLYMYCENNEDCKKLSNTKCVKYNCVCKDNHDVLNTTTCAPLLGEYCENNQQCAPDNSICIHNTCQCSDDYKKYNNRCISKTGYFEVSCDKDDDCKDIKFAKCSSEQKCMKIVFPIILFV